MLVPLAGEERTTSSRLLEGDRVGLEEAAALNSVQWGADVPRYHHYLVLLVLEQVLLDGSGLFGELRRRLLLLRGRWRRRHDELVLRVVFVLTAATCKRLARVVREK